MNRVTTGKATVAWLAAAVLALGAPALAQEGQGQGQAIVTVMSKDKHVQPAPVPQQALRVQVNGREANITQWAPATSPLEVVVAIDSSARTSLGRQLQDIANFVQSLPPDARVAIGYMQNGQTYLATPLTTNKMAALQGLHLPAGSPGSNASPYFCLSDLAKHWPSNDREARREVVMITNGVDNYDRRFDPEDPYVQAAIADAARAGLIVNSIYWTDEGRFNRGFYQTNAGQSLLLEVSQATGGTTYWQGYGNPVSFQPYFEDLNRRFRNQYELSFETHLKGKPEVETLRLKVNAPGTKVDAPQQVLVAPGGVATTGTF
jgi:hypothetical protein